MYYCVTYWTYEEMKRKINIPKSGFEKVLIFKTYKNKYLGILLPTTPATTGPE